jgi:PTH1 family peptidyl-tRNA hydrolase
MNVCGKTIVETIKDFLPPPTPLIVEQTSSSPPDQDQHDHQQKKKEKENKKKLAPPFSLLKPIPKLLILCDDLDLSPLSCRLQRSGGPKGHNGIRSLISASASPSSCNNSKDFWRFWIGIGRPPGEGLERGKGVSQWVLGPLSREEVEAVELNQEEGGGRGGVVLERAWKEVLKIGFEEEGI